MLDSYISALCRYAERTGLLQPEDLVFARNALLEALQLDSFDEAAAPAEASLADILQVLTGDAVARGVCPDNQVARDLFDTKLMGVLTPRPHEVRTCFHTLYQISPQKATDWFYRFSQDTNYIRRDRIAKDQKWVYEGKYGALDITINDLHTLAKALKKTKLFKTRHDTGAEEGGEIWVLPLVFDEL